MKLYSLNISNNNFLLNKKQNKVSFGASSRWYDLKDYSLSMPMGNFTNMFRKDVDWFELAKYEHELFTNEDKVNVIQFAASTGAEAYSKIISLIEAYSREKAQKFFPIKAVDIDSDIIDIAKSGLINFNQSEINDFVTKKSDIQKYFKPYEYNLALASDNCSVKQKTYSAKDILKNNVNFEVGDMFKMAKDIDNTSCSIVLARNSLSYFNAFLKENFIEVIASKLKPKSLFIIGELETEIDTDIVPLLQQHNFKKVMKNVFQKN